MRYRILKLLLTAALAVAGVAAAASDTAAVTPAQVIEHLNRTIAWYGHVSAADQSTGEPQNLVLEESVRQSSREVVRKAFAFARAEAAVLNALKKTAAPGAAASPGGQAHSLEQSAAEASERIAKLQAAIDDINGQIGKASRRKLAILVSQRDTLTADLAFAKSSQKTLNEILQFANASDKGSGLLGQINLLANSDSVPAALNDTPQQSAANTATAHAQAANASSSTFRPESAGIAALIGRCFQTMRTRDQINSLIGETNKTADQLNELRAPLRLKIRELVSEGDRIASAASGETDPNQLNSQRQQVEKLAVRFKSVSSTIAPLSEQNLALESTLGALEQWREAAGTQFQSVLGFLGFRLGTLAFAVIVLLIVSEIVRRATFRYVRDTRRRRQFVLIRRFVVGTLATVIVVVASVSGIGSFATVAGFVTAGLAVALQNVILSVVAYFFLIGRYGLRAGDRVTVSGVSGQVIEVGLVRLYLMELAGAGTDQHSTGRVAVFSNSVIFQPAALIKQAPGTEYTWHVVTVTFAGETDLEGSRARIMQAVEAVYAKYRKTIEQQHQAFERTANIQLASPAPVSRGRYTDAGVEVSVRYPVEIDGMTEVDEKIVDSVASETRQAPELKLAPGGYPKISPAT